MSKKLIITENQLKTIIERKHSYVDNSPEGEMEEGEMMGAESAIVKPEEEVEEMDDMEFEFNEEDEVELDIEMNESLKAIKANFKRFL
jgi:hypothetical protein